MVPLRSNILCLFIFIFFTQNLYYYTLHYKMTSSSFDAEDEVGEVGFNDTDSDVSPSVESEDGPFEQTIDSIVQVYCRRISQTSR